MDATQEALFVDGQDPRGPFAAYGRRACLFLEKGHFAEEVVSSEVAQVQFPAIPDDQDFDLAILDDVHAIPWLSLANDDLAVPVLLAQSGHRRAPLSSANSFQF